MHDRGRRLRRRKGDEPEDRRDRPAGGAPDVRRPVAHRSRGRAAHVDLRLLQVQPARCLADARPGGALRRSRRGALVHVQLDVPGRRSVKLHAS